MAIGCWGNKIKPLVVSGTLKSDEYLEKCLPFYRRHDTPPILWPDLASTHYSKQVVNWLVNEKVTFGLKEYNPPNTLELRPIK